MSAVVLAVVRLPHVSTIDRDADEMTFCFQGSQANAGALAADLQGGGTAGILQDFVNHNGGGTHPLSTYLANGISRLTNAATVEYYDITTHLDGTNHGSPVAVHPFTINNDAGSAVDLPAQVAACISVHGSGWATAAVEGPSVTTIPTPDAAQDMGAPATHSGRTRPKSRHAGRIYTGALNSLTLAEVAGEGRMSNAFLSDLVDQSTALLASTLALTTDTRWSVWSRANAAIDEIVGGFVDNAFDIQRRRRVASTIKFTWA